MSSKLISVAEVDLPISAVCNNPVGSLTPVPFMKMFSSARPKRLANSLLRYASTGKFSVCDEGAVQFGKDSKFIGTE